MPRGAATGRILLVLAAVDFHMAFGQQSKPAFVREFKWPSPPGSTFPEGEWERVKSSETENYSSAKLGALRVWLKTQRTTGMLVVVRGRVLFEYGDVAQARSPPFARAFLACCWGIMWPAARSTYRRR